MVWGGAFGLSLWGTGLALNHLRGSKRRVSCGPPISILKPLKGLDPGLKENLKSFFELTYPRFEIIFCLESFHDPAFPVIESLKSDYPHTDVKILVGRSKESLNPKVSNLLKGYKEAAFDHLLISDSNVRVRTDYLSSLISHWDSQDIGLVTAGVVADSSEPWGSRLEALSLNAQTLRWIFILSNSGTPLVMGKSMFFRRSTFERFGGLQALGRYLAEDYMAGFALRRLGLKIVQSHEPLRQFLGDAKLSSYWSRQVRWGRIRRMTSPHTFILEPLSFCAVSGMIGALAASATRISSFASFLILHCLTWFCADLLMNLKFDRRLDWKFPAVWCLRETLNLPIWLWPLLSRSVLWRGHALKILPGGELERA